ncbi:Uncharacterised protein [Mycobacterium tuberculosis]|uniref:Uncharacterized protein n=1 Tax=Mycobacterium tuberculosis TaxID=1773 RepID=A0A655ADE1_MYCTX|nr:Uncharacterised protein [Mycobacterium tuberculosis]CKU27227.1 Uncharacterised protein [Mycobacterium tuberculosis]
MAGRAAGRGRGVRGLRSRLRARAADTGGEPERRRDRGHLPDRRGLHSRAGSRRLADQAATCTRGHRVHRRGGGAGHHRRIVRGGAVCGVRVPGRARRVDAGSCGGHRPDRRAGRRRGAAADDAVAARPRGRGRRCRTHPGQPQRGRLSGRVGRRAGLAIPAAAAVRDDPRCGGHRHRQSGGRRGCVDLPAAPRRVRPATGDRLMRARRGARADRHTAGAFPRH